MNAGKRFEQAFRRQAEKNYWVLRINDCVYMVGGRLASNKSVADFFLCDGKHSFLVECKATKNKSLRFDALQPHQLQGLNEFDALGEYTHGVIAVEFYESNYRTSRRMFLMPSLLFSEIQSSSKKKSISIKTFEALAFECPKWRGSYQIDLKDYLTYQIKDVI